MTREEFLTKYWETLNSELDLPASNGLPDLAGCDVLTDLWLDKEGLIDASQVFSEKFDVPLQVNSIMNLNAPNSIPILLRLFELQKFFWNQPCGVSLGELMEALYSETYSSHQSGK